MDSYKELQQSTANLKLSFVEFKAALPPWMLSRQMFYMGVVMFLSLSTFRLIAALMLLVRIRWLANWFMERSPNRRGKIHGV